MIGLKNRNILVKYIVVDYSVDLEVGKCFDDKRTVVLVGHNGSGKSTFMVSALNLGGIPVTKKEIDFDPVEVKEVRINSHVGTFEFEGKQITLIDTPGL